MGARAAEPDVDKSVLAAAVDESVNSHTAICGSRDSRIWSPLTVRSCRLLVSACGARDVSYSLFHGVGKVLFSKSDADVDSVIDRCAADHATLFSFVHSNYTAHLTLDHYMERTAHVAHIFSMADDIAQSQHAASMGDVTTQHSTLHTLQRERGGAHRSSSGWLIEASHCVLPRACHAVLPLVCWQSGTAIDATIACNLACRYATCSRTTQEYHRAAQHCVDALCIATLTCHTAPVYCWMCGRQGLHAAQATVRRGSHRQRAGRTSGQRPQQHESGQAASQTACHPPSHALRSMPAMQPHSSPSSPCHRCLCAAVSSVVSVAETAFVRRR